MSVRVGQVGRGVREGRFWGVTIDITAAPATANVTVKVVFGGV